MASYEDQVIIKFSADLRELLSGITQARDALKDMTQASQANATANTQLSTSMTSAASSSRGMTTNLRQANTTAMDSVSSFKELDNQTGKFSTSFRKIALSLTTGSNELDKLSIMFDRASMQMWKFTMAAMPLREIGLMLGGLGAGLGFGLKKIIEAGDLIDRVNRQFLAIYESERIATDVSAYLVEQAKHIRYTMDEVLEAGRLLAVEGFDPKELIMPMADLAAGVGQEGLTIVHATRAFVDATNGYFKRLKETFQVTADDVRRIAPDAFFPTGAIKDKALATEAIIAAINRKYVGMNEATVQTISGQMSMMNDAIIQTMASMSEAVNPMVMDIMKNIEIKVKKINEFAKTDFGQITTRTAAYATGLTILAGGASFAASGIVTLLGVLASYRTFVATMTPGAQGGLADIIKGELELMAVTREIGQVEADRAMKSLPMLRKRLELTKELRTAEEARMNIVKAELLGSSSGINVAEQEKILSGATARASALEAELDIPMMEQEFYSLGEAIQRVEGNIRELGTTFPNIEEAPASAINEYNKLATEVNNLKQKARELQHSMELGKRLDIPELDKNQYTSLIEESERKIAEAREEKRRGYEAFGQEVVDAEAIRKTIGDQERIIDIENKRISIIKERGFVEKMATEEAKKQYDALSVKISKMRSFLEKPEERIDLHPEVSAAKSKYYDSPEMDAWLKTIKDIEKIESEIGEARLEENEAITEKIDLLESELRITQSLMDSKDREYERQKEQLILTSGGTTEDLELAKAEKAAADLKEYMSEMRRMLEDPIEMADIGMPQDKIPPLLAPVREWLEASEKAKQIEQEIATLRSAAADGSVQEANARIATLKEKEQRYRAMLDQNEESIKALKESLKNDIDGQKEKLRLMKEQRAIIEKENPDVKSKISQFGAGFKGGFANIMSPVLSLVTGPLRLVVNGTINAFRNVQKALAEGGPKMAGAITGNIVALGLLAGAAIYTAWAENEKRKNTESLAAALKSATDRLDAWANALSVNEFERNMLDAQKKFLSALKQMGDEMNIVEISSVDVLRVGKPGSPFEKDPYGVSLERVFSERAGLSEEEQQKVIRRIAEELKKREGEIQTSIQYSTGKRIATKLLGPAEFPILGPSGSSVGRRDAKESDPAYQAYQKLLAGEMPSRDELRRINIDRGLLEEITGIVQEEGGALGGFFKERERIAVEATERYIAAQEKNWDNLSEYEKEVITQIKEHELPYRELRIHLDDVAKSLDMQVDDIKNVESSMNEALRTGEDFSKVYEEHLQKYQKAVEANRKLNELLETRIAINAKEEDSLRAQVRERERALKIAEKDLEVAVAKRNLEMAGKWAEYAGAGGASEAFLFGPEMEENYRKIGEHGKAMKAVADNIKDTAALARDLQQVSEYASPQQKAQSSANLARIAREEARRMKEEVFDPLINEMERQGMTEEADKIRLVARARLSSLERDAQKHQVDASRTLLESDLDRMEVQRRIAAVGTKHEHELYNYDVAILAKKEEIARITNNQNELMNIQAEKAELIKRTEESIEQAKRNQLSETEALYSSQLQYLEALNSTGFLGDEVIEQAKGRMYNFFVWMAGQFNYGTAEWYQNMTKALGFLEQETEDGYDGMISKILGAPSELVESVISEGSLARRFSQMAGSLGDIRGDILSSSGNEIVVRIKADLPLHQIESRVNEALPGVMENLGRDLIAAMG